jgi:hypothetical protein
VIAVTNTTVTRASPVSPANAIPMHAGGNGHGKSTSSCIEDVEMIPSIG